MSTARLQIERSVEILSTLVAIDTVNPMGRAHDRTMPVERGAIEYIETLFAPYRHRARMSRQSCSPAHENLVIVLPGENERPAALFESHIDTVPADSWMDRALKPIVKNDELFGLGACDDKGCLTAMIAALLETIESGVTPPHTIVLVCAGDEECAQTGVRRFMKDSPEQFGFGVVGEPTRLCPVIQHKGTVRWDITVHGTSAHTSQPEFGANAILGGMEVIRTLDFHQHNLRSRFKSDLVTGPTITVTKIAGGRTRNAVPDECTMAVDVRVLPGMNPAAEREAIINLLASLEWTISHSEVQLLTPPLATAADSPLCREALSICREVTRQEMQLAGAPYGTDAAWIGQACPTIVLGPGDIRFAHAADERISLTELRQAIEIYRRLMNATIASAL
jgi:acetylornithine deacetylase